MLNQKICVFKICYDVFSGASKIRHVVVACAYNFPSGPIIRPSAVAVWRPTWTIFPSARTRGVASVSARTNSL